MFLHILSDVVTASKITVQLTDVPVFEVNEKLKTISNAQLEEELASCLKDFEGRFVSGYDKFLINVSDKANLLQKVTRYYEITRQLEAIQQFTSALSSHSVLSNLQKLKAQTEKGCPSHPILSPQNTCKIFIRLSSWLLATEILNKRKKTLHTNSVIL